MSVGAAAAVSAMVSLGLVGVGAGSTAAHLLNGQAWLANARTGTVSQANGYSGKVSAAVRTGLQASDPFTVVQRSDGAYVVDERTGKLVRINGAKLQASNASVVPGLDVPNVQVITGGGRTYVVDHSAGQVQQVNPDTLRPVGSMVSLHSPISNAVTDPRGDLWVAVPGQGSIIEVNGSRAVSHQVVGQDDDAISDADTSVCVASVDASSGVAKCVSRPGPVAHFHGGANRIPVVAASPSSPNVVSVEGTEATLLNVQNGTSQTATLPQGAQVDQAVVNGDQAYLLDASSHQVDTVNLSNASLGPTLSPPGGATDLTVSGGLVFANDANGSEALAIAPNGSQVPIQKYDPEHPFAGVGPAPQGSAGTGTAAAAASAPAASTSQVFSPTVAPTPADPTTVGPAVGLPTTSGGAPTSSGGAPTSSGGAPTSSGGAPTSSGGAPTTPPGPGGTTPPRPGTTTTTTTPAGPPGQPNVTVTPGTDSVTASWSLPTGGTPAASYNVTDTAGHQQHGITTTELSITGLKPGVQDCITVQAVNASGQAGPFSAAKCATPAAPSTTTTTIPPTTTTTVAPTTTTTVPPTTTTTVPPTTTTTVPPTTTTTVPPTTTTTTPPPSTTLVYLCYRPDLAASVPASYAVSTATCGSGGAYNQQYSQTIASWRMVVTDQAPGTSNASWTAPTRSPLPGGEYLYNCYTPAPYGYLTYHLSASGKASCSYQGGAYTDGWVFTSGGTGFEKLYLQTGPNGINAVAPTVLSGFSVSETFYTYTG